jgi:hypothetical protein
MLVLFNYMVFVKLKLYMIKLVPIKKKHIWMLKVYFNLLAI